MKSIEKSSVLVAGLVRDCEKTLLSDVSRLTVAFSQASKLSFLIIESDSSDNTLALLRNHALAEENFDYVSLGSLRNKYASRTERIAYCRNCYLSIIRESQEMAGYDYVVIADMDGVNSNVTMKAVASCWARSDWDVCTANQEGPYYDIWALRHHLWSPNDCWQQAEFLNRHGLSRFRSVFSAVISRMTHLPRCSEWVEVESAFGGLAIYKAQALLSAHYIGLLPNGDDVCEHISVHSQIRKNNGRIFINPALINYVGLFDHAKYAHPIWLLAFLVRAALVDILCCYGFLPFAKSCRAVLKNL